MPSFILSRQENSVLKRGRRFLSDILFIVILHWHSIPIAYESENTLLNKLKNVLYNGDYNLVTFRYLAIYMTSHPLWPFERQALYSGWSSTVWTDAMSRDQNARQNHSKSFERVEQFKYWEQT
jgi:hypothetical protein